MRERFAAPLVALLAFAAAPALAQDGQADWQKTIDAANAEGSLILYSQPNQDARSFLLREFPKAYPRIKLSLSVLDSSEFVTRIRTERSAGKYLWDVALSGPPGGIILSHDGILDPVLPEIVDPTTKNPDLWGGWHDAFMDTAGQYVFAMAKFIAGPWYNAMKVPPDKVASEGLKLLLDPSVKGKIAWHDPTLTGSGQSYAYLLRVKLGDDALKTLVLDQKVDFVAQQFQVVDAMARGTASIGIGPPVRSLMGTYTKAGVKTDMRSISATVARRQSRGDRRRRALRLQGPAASQRDPHLHQLAAEQGRARGHGQGDRAGLAPPGCPAHEPARRDTDQGRELRPAATRGYAPAVRQTVQLISEWRKAAK